MRRHRRRWVVQPRPINPELLTAAMKMRLHLMRLAKARRRRTGPPGDKLATRLGLWKMAQRRKRLGGSISTQQVAIGPKAS